MASWCRGDGDLPTAIREHEVDYILLSGSFIEEYRAQRADYPCETEVYEDLLAMYPVVETFDREDASLGGTILVLDANVAKAEALITEVDALPGPEMAARVGQDDVQAALETIANGGSAEHPVGESIDAGTAEADAA